MDTMGLWLIIGAASVLAGICVILLQKKAGEAAAIARELASVKDELEQSGRRLSETRREQEQALQTQGREIDALAQSLAAEQEQNSRLRDKLDETARELQQARDDAAHKRAELTDLATQLETGRAAVEETEELAREVASLKENLAEMTEKLAGVEKHFEAQMDEVVQSSIQKITHAEEAKEEAVQAAQDNFEAAAEANARLKEMEALVKKLQGR